MMKKTCFLFLLLCCSLALMAQDFEIVSVESLPLDMSAREEIHTDHNNRQCALLRIATQNIAPNQRELFTFVPDYGSEMVQRATRDGEIWLWVSPGLKYLRVKHRDWGQYELRLIDHVARVEALHTYKIIIKGTMVLALQEQNNNSPTQQYLVFQLSPTNAMLEVDGQLWEVAPDGTAMKFVNFGTYSYRVQAPNYLPETGKVTVDDPNNTKTVNVKLKSDFVEITLQVEADAEIWVNNKKKGTRTWTGQLGKGIYKIECKKESHETTAVSKEITTEMSGQTITLPAPTPIYGSLNVESTPIGATIYIDGKEVGKTPKFINEILVGRHDLKLTKNGYNNYNDTVLISKNERKQVDIDFSNANTKQNAPQGALCGLFSVSPTKQVWFSKGNLQYRESTNTWRFAEKQWDYIGEKRERVLYKSWIDLFGWGTSGYNHRKNCYQPSSWQTTSSAYYAYDNEEKDLYSNDGRADWGYNAISNGGDQECQWRTLTIDEWKYLFDNRETASGLRYIRAKVNGINGIIVFPDNWDEETYKLNTLHSGTENSYDNNIISKNDWLLFFESKGSVFLPASGYRTDSYVFLCELGGYYWSSNSCKDIFNSDPFAMCLSFSDEFVFYNNEIRSRGCSVRLVRDY